MDEDIASLRVDYGAHELTQRAAGGDPMGLFAAWFADAAARPEVVEANATSLATATPDGAPSVRMVLLKAVDPARAAFTWFTNLDSRKAREIAARQPPRAALAWWWPGRDGRPGRQVRATGVVERVAREDAARYFDARPVEARIGTIASQQSRPIADRAALDARAASVDPDALRIPDGWGGLRLVADELEFWQGRSGRLHDRIAFLRADAHPEPEVATRVTDLAGTNWYRVRLQP